MFARRSFAAVASLALPAFALLSLWSGRAHGGSVTANLSVTANVLDSCTVNGATLGLGSYDPTASTAVTGTNPFSVTCTLGTIATIKLGQGANAATGSSDSAPLRRMTDGSSHYLSYALYQDSLNLFAWGNTTLTGKVYTSLSNSAVSIPVYGTIAAGQNATAGVYSDTVVITVAF